MHCLPDLALAIPHNAISTSSLPETLYGDYDSYYRDSSKSLRIALFLSDSLLSVNSVNPSSQPSSHFGCVASPKFKPRASAASITSSSLTLYTPHRLNGVSNHISATYTIPELVYQLEKVKPLDLFTCLPLLAQALEAAATVGIPIERVPARGAACGLGSDRAARRHPHRG